MCFALEGNSLAARTKYVGECVFVVISDHVENYGLDVGVRLAKGTDVGSAARGNVQRRKTQGALTRGPLLPSQICLKASCAVIG